MFSYFASLFELFNFQETILVGGVIVIYVCVLQAADYLQLLSYEPW
jgi:hypothetical protein